MPSVCLAVCCSDRPRKGFVLTKLKKKTGKSYDVYKCKNAKKMQKVRVIGVCLEIELQQQEKPVWSSQRRGRRSSREGIVAVVVAPPLE